MAASITTVGTITGGSTYDASAVAITGGTIKLDNGTKSAPSYSWASEATSGRHRSGSAYYESVLGVNVYAWTGSVFALASAIPFVWSSGDPEAQGADTGVSRVSAGVTGFGTGAAAAIDGETRAAIVSQTGANGQLLSVKSLSELTTIAAAATTDTTIQMPANAVILGVSVRVTTAIPTATNFTVGDSGSAARFSTAAVSSAANSTDPGTKAGAYYNASALSVRITPDATPAANTGRLRTTIHYYTVTPPTS